MYFQRFINCTWILPKNKYYFRSNVLNASKNIQISPTKTDKIVGLYVTYINVIPRSQYWRLCRPSHAFVGHFLCQRTIYTTSPNRALPPILWIFLRSFLRFGAVITGRSLRKWWRNLPDSKRQYILKQINRHRQKLMAGALMSGFATYFYYKMHLVEDPLTKRKKFIMFSEKQINQMAMIEYETIMENYKGKIIRSGYHYNVVSVITQRILNANKELPGTNKKWHIFVINDKEVKNAFVLPSGHIFIFTGMLAVVSNEHQLAAIICHEMAHALLSHTAEIVSKTHLLEMLLLLPLVVIWTVFPDSVAIFSHYITEYAGSILFQLPFTRSLETEADIVGLGMMSRACYDPKQASMFWRKMESFSKDEPVEWLSTHPSHQSRYETLEEYMPNALKIVVQLCKKQDPRLLG